MGKTTEQLDEEFFMSIRDTVDDMFARMFPAKMFCEGDAELIEDFEDVVDEDEEEEDDQE